MIVAEECMGWDEETEAVSQWGSIAIASPTSRIAPASTDGGTA